MKKTTSILLLIVVIAISISSCKKDELEKTINNKTNFTLSDKTVMIDGTLCYQYINNTTGQILYEEVNTNDSAKEEVSRFKKELKETIVGSRSYFSCDNDGTNCYVGADPSGGAVLVIKSGATTK